jgi:hypothetical protein
MNWFKKDFQDKIMTIMGIALGLLLLWLLGDTNSFRQ